MKPLSPLYIPLKDFMWYAMHTTLEKEWVEIDETLATIIQAIDPLESVAHVQMPSEDNDLITPKLWRVEAWRTCYERYRKVKEQDAIQRDKRIYTRDLIHRLADAIVEHMMLEQDHAVRIARSYAKSETKLTKAMHHLLDGEVLDKTKFIYE